ncbi:MAG: hypothetical protein M1835_003517 [Candelina submexicana]|nr:MAG: hypothetical protein M1835_003517 [Candelina submexicana]
MEMTKFSSAEDPGYLAVSTELRRWVRNIQPAQQRQDPYNSPSAVAPYEERQEQPPPRQDYYSKRGPRQDYYLEQAPQSHSPWPQRSQAGNEIHGNITNTGVGMFGMNVGGNMNQQDYYNPQQQQRQYAPSPHQGQLSPYQTYPPPQPRSPPAHYQQQQQQSPPSWQSYPSPQPHSPPPQWPSRDHYAPGPHPPAPSPHHSDYDSHHSYTDPRQQMYTNSPYARQPSPYQDSQPAYSPGPRVQQGANQINVGNQSTWKGGKTVQGMNISSDKDVTFNF